MQKIGIHYIEDCIEILAGIQNYNLKFTVKNSDIAIINSIARQVHKGVALTDKQYALMKIKLLEYKTQFDDNDIIGLDRALTKLRNELRTIDRSKIVTVSAMPNHIVYQDYLQGNFIKIRFPFAKGLIVKIESLAQKYKNIYFHSKGSHEHYFVLTESTIFDVVETFIDKGFIIDDILLESYNKILEIKKNMENYVPGIYSMQLKNVHPKSLKLIEENIGELNNDTLVKFVDRRRRYGFEVFDSVECNNDILQNIVSRTDTTYLSKPSKESFEDVVNGLNVLDRFPLLVILDSYAETQMKDCINSFNFAANQQICLFRLEGEHTFNRLISQHNLNTWLDNSIKVVYINSKKLPKLLLKNDWKPIAAVAFTSHLDRQVANYISNNCDLIVFREEDMSPFRLHSQYYANW